VINNPITRQMVFAGRGLGCWIRAGHNPDVRPVLRDNAELRQAVTELSNPTTWRSELLTTLHQNVWITGCLAGAADVVTGLLDAVVVVGFPAGYEDLAPLPVIDGRRKHQLRAHARVLARHKPGPMRRGPGGARPGLTRSGAAARGRGLEVLARAHRDEGFGHLPTARRYPWAVHLQFPPGLGGWSGWCLYAPPLLRPAGDRLTGWARSGRVRFMSAARRWSDLSPRTRKMIIAGAAAESALKAVALVDLKRRPASEIRGPKWAWIPGLTVVNSAGIVPLAYLSWGRRASPRA
jgi:hypothetical protein